MVERPVPQNILKYKQKAMKNFSAREVIFGSIGIFVFGICMLNLGGIEEINVRVLVSVLPAMPFLILGFIKIYDVPFEKIIGPILLDNFINPAKRKKEHHNISMEQYESLRPWTREIADPKKRKKMMKRKCIKSRTLKAYK